MDYGFCGLDCGGQRPDCCKKRRSENNVLQEWWASSFFRAGLKNIERTLGLCTDCRERLSSCTCHERGYN